MPSKKTAKAKKTSKELKKGKKLEATMPLAVQKKWLPSNFRLKIDGLGS